MSSTPDDLTQDPATIDALGEELTRLPGFGSPPAEAAPPLHDLAPGSIIAGRYRLIALLGRGGMGEVFRAEDLTLDQPVALKFLPPGVAADTRRLEHFHNELRVARQVSHKNVCRLYDLGDANGRRFLTMEYVDGEDLASLLRRIGRIPEDKAIEIARQLCAGIAAAHERGVLHRDLKPANVMLDGQGHVRITDFGLAVSAGDAKAVLAGTPQYMAPEQLKGLPATIQSDIYALGLILFEVFTGRRVHEARTLDELRDFHESGSITTPTSLVRDLSPSIERIILRCLGRDPARRPQSALAVAAALPGGNPIAEALAAGETPSPDMLAAAGEAEALSPLKGLGFIAAFLVGIALFFALSRAMSIPGLVALTRPTEVLLDRADSLAAALGYSEPYRDRAYGTMVWNEYQTWTQRTHPSDWKDVLRTGRPSPVVLWYRTSPQPLAPWGAELTLTDPPHLVDGMRTMRFDAEGRLIEFRVVPADRQPAGDNRATDWDPLFEAAGLRRSDFIATAPTGLPRMYGDSRAAWAGNYLQRPDFPVRIEAAALNGRPVWFQIFGPWTVGAASSGETRTRTQIIANRVSAIVLVSALMIAAFVARYNVVGSRADRRGARRLGMLIAVGGVVVWVAAPHSGAVDVEIPQLFKNLGYAALWGTGCWILYLAIEPYARRFWPDGLLGWSRLLAGHIRDPRVGRDVLLGLAVSAAFMVLNAGIRAIQMGAESGRRVVLFGNEVMSLSHPTMVVGTWAASALDAMFTALLAALLYIGARSLFKRTWLAAAVSVAVFAVLINSGAIISAPNWIERSIVFFRSAVIIALTLRIGLLPFVLGVAVADLLTDVPLTLHALAWYATPSNVTLLMLVALTGFGYYAARGGQPLFGRLSSRAAIGD